METKRLAVVAVRTARDAVARLAQESLESHRFRDVAWCADLAEQLSRLLEAAGANGPPAPASQNGAAKAGEADPAKGAEGRIRPKSPHYPAFYRDGDTLVKIGWSKSQNGEYEHRAPRRAAEALVDAVAAGDNGELFGMDAVLPLRDAAGGDLPSYQVYLALAWLRAENAVQRHGRDGYTLDPAYKDVGKLGDLWGRLPTARP